MLPAFAPLSCLASGWQLSPDLPARLLVIAGFTALAAWVSAGPRFPGRRVFTALQTVAVAWMLAATVEHAAADAACKATVALGSWLAIMSLPPLWAWFVWRAANPNAALPAPWRHAGIAITATLAVGPLSNGAHGLFYGPDNRFVADAAGFMRLHWDRGPLFAATAAIGYVWMALAGALVVRSLRDCAPEDRRRWGAFLVVMSVPWLTNAAHIGLGVRLLGADPTPLSFAVALAGFAWLMRSSGLHAVLPMSRRLLFTGLQDPVLVLDRHDRVVDGNAAAERLAGVPLRGRRLAELPAFGAVLEARLAGGTLEAAGRVFDVHASDVGARGQRLGRLLQLRDVTDRHHAMDRLQRALADRDAQLHQVAQLQAELREQALRDSLTGLHNRRALAEHFAALRRRAGGEPLALVLIDIDHFKRINDSAGHAAGDAVLQALARALVEGLRTDDGVFRVGGEEFALLLPGADGAGALHRVEALRHAVAAALSRPDGTPLTFSAGIADAGDRAQPLDVLLRRADAALYTAKALGRARSVLGDVTT